MRVRLRMSFVGLLLATFAPVAVSQAQAPPNTAGNPQRAALEQRLRERTAQVVKRRLQLTDAQMTQLQQSNRKFEGQRVEILGRERAVRRDLRQELAAGDNANQAKVGQLMDQMMQLERQRLELLQNEQRDLAKFLTPVQRARLFGLQNELRRRAQEMRNGPAQRRNTPEGPGPMRFEP